MTQVKLDPRKLLGFKIIAGHEGASSLHSPKIGGKGCPGVTAQGEPSVGAIRSKTV